MTPPRILIAGIGNIFFGDDAFGVEVVRRLVQQPLPEGVTAVDFGIRGFDLGSAIMDGYDAVFLIDAVSRGGRPGTLSVIEPDLDSLAAMPFDPAMGGHALGPARVLQWVLSLGGSIPFLRLVGCEPAAFSSDGEPHIGLSPLIAEAVDRALPMILSLIDDFASQSTFGART